MEVYNFASIREVNTRLNRDCKASVTNKKFLRHINAAVRHVTIPQWNHSENWQI